MAPLLSYHPFKGIFTLLTISTVGPYLAVLAVIYQIRAFRPCPEWKFQTALANKVLQIFYKYATLIRLKPTVHTTAPKALEPKDRYIMVKPHAPEFYSGVLNLDEKIKPVSVPAVWFPRAYNKETDHGKTVVLHFQGGGFVHAGDPMDLAPYPASLYEKYMEDSLTFYAQYRLSRDDATRFPAALQDAVSFYRYLLDLGVKPEDIIVSGDSAGGNLVLAFARYISENEGALPVPKGIMAWSPWVDLREETINAHASSPLRHTDFVSSLFGHWGRSAYFPLNQPITKEVEAYISPVQYPFLSRTKLFLQVGTVELLITEVRKFARKMEKLEGNRVWFEETRNACHDIILAGPLLGLGKEAESAVQKAWAFFEEKAVEGF